jgi:hypothetical protein
MADLRRIARDHPIAGSLTAMLRQKLIFANNIVLVPGVR